MSYLTRSKSDDEAGSNNWETRQKKAFTRWINAKLEGRGLRVEDLFTDLRDGVVLYNLLEVLANQSLAKYGTLTPGKTRIHQITNMSVVFKYLRKTVKIVAIGTHDIVDGNPSLTLGLIWSIIVFFVTKDVGQKNTDFGQYKQALIQWAQRMISENPEFKDQIVITNLTSSFADGRAFQAMLHQTTQGTFAYAPTSDVVENLTRAFDFAADHYGIARILDPNDVHCCADEKAMVTYLSEFMHKVADKSKFFADQEGELTATQRMGLYLEQHSEAIEEDISTLMAQKALVHHAEANLEDCQRCANVVVEHLRRRGIASLQTIYPQDESEDFSDIGAPVVVADVIRNPDYPTVMFYTSYASTDANQPADKSNVVAAIAALEAFVNVAGELGVNVRLVVGATPLPRQTISYPLDTTKLPELSAKIERFFTGHLSDTKLDVLVVSAPVIAAAKSGSAVVQFSSRGEARVSMTVSVKEQRFGNRIDALQALAFGLGSLRDDRTLEFRETLLTHAAAEPSLPARTYMDELAHIEARTPSSESKSDVRPEQEVRKILSGTFYLPDIQVTGITFKQAAAVGEPSRAHCELSLSLPPGVNALRAREELEKAVRANIPLIADVSFSDAMAADGWESNNGDIVLPVIKDAVEAAFSPIPTIAHPCPSYDPISAGLRASFPDTEIFLVGVDRLRGGSISAVEAGKAVVGVIGAMPLVQQTASAAIKYSPRLIGRFDPTLDVRSNSKDIEPALPAQGTIVRVTSQQSVIMVSSIEQDSDPSFVLPSSSGSPFDEPETTPGSDDEKENLYEMSPPPIVSSPSQEQYVMKKVEERKPYDFVLYGDDENHEMDDETIAALVLDEINSCRENPRDYAESLNQYRSCFKGKTYTSPARQLPYTTREGVAALDDAIAFLRTCNPVNRLTAVQPLAQAANDHLLECFFNDLKDTFANDDHDVSQRLDQYCQWYGPVGQVMAWAEDDPSSIVMKLLVSDGDPRRMSRRALLNPQFQVCGVATGEHQSLGYTTVVTFARIIRPKPVLEAVDIVCRAEDEPSSTFQAVVDSIPVESLTKRIEEARRTRSHDIRLIYIPGRVHAILSQSGHTEEIEEQWGSE